MKNFLTVLFLTLLTGCSGCWPEKGLACAFSNFVGGTILGDDMSDNGECNSPTDHMERIEQIQGTQKPIRAPTVHVAARPKNEAYITRTRRKLSFNYETNTMTESIDVRWVPNDLWAEADSLDCHLRRSRTIRDNIVIAAQCEGVDVQRALNVAAAESTYKADAVSVTGATGVYQFTIGTWNYVAEKLNVPEQMITYKKVGEKRRWVQTGTDHRLDPLVNIRFAMWLAKHSGWHHWCGDKKAGKKCRDEEKRRGLRTKDGRPLYASK